MVHPLICGEDIVCSQFERLWWQCATAGSSVPIKLFSKIQMIKEMMSNEQRKVMWDLLH